MKKIEKINAETYHKRRVNLMIIYLIIWAIVSFGAVSVAPFLNNFTLNGFPFGYFMAAQGAIVTFVILLFINAIMSDKIDQQFDLSEKPLKLDADINETNNKTL